MKFIERFDLVNEEENIDFVKKIKNSYSDDEWFPLGFFNKKGLKQIDFEPVTIFYGGNGSGKSTLLNVIAENMGLLRRSDVSVTRAFTDYAMACTLRKTKNVIIPMGSRMLTSEDIFRNIFNARQQNLALEEKKQEQDEFFDYAALDKQFDSFDNSHLISKRLAKKIHLEKSVERRERQFSNGETALKFFKDEIQRKTLYLLDEPENSMSPQFQMQLKSFIEDCATHAECQFIIATHSPFVLAINGAKIYDLDSKPVIVQKWYDLKNIRITYDFFIKNKELFELGIYDKGVVPKKKPTTTVKK